MRHQFLATEPTDMWAKLSIFLSLFAVATLTVAWVDLYGCWHKLPPGLKHLSQSDLLQSGALTSWGGLAFPSKKGYVFPIQTAEKGILWLRIKAKGTPGHGSMPNIADNAIMRMNKVVEILGNYKSETMYVSTLRQFLDEM